MPDCEGSVDIRWRILGDNVLDNLMNSCFSLSLVDTPARVLMAVRDRVDAAADAHRNVFCEVSRDLWRLTGASTIHAIWCARLLHHDHEPDALESTLRAVALQ